MSTNEKSLIKQKINSENQSIIFIHAANTHFAKQASEQNKLQLRVSNWVFVFDRDNMFSAEFYRSYNIK